MRNTEVSGSFKREPHPYMTSDILIVTKQSKVEYDSSRLNLKIPELIEFYHKQGVPLDRIFESHERQKKYTAQLERFFPGAKIINFGINQDSEICGLAAGYKLIISFGGDNHFQRVARCIKGDQSIAGVNSDPATSRGALLPFSADELETLASGLKSGSYNTIPWTRIQVNLDGEVLAPVLCDVFIGERERQYMSRYILEAGEKQVEQKSSGLLISTGAGSGGWFTSATQYLFPHDVAFPGTSRKIIFAATELSKTGSVELPFGVLSENDVLSIQSLNDSDGVLALDSLSMHSFPSGHRARIRADPEPLWTTVK